MTHIYDLMNAQLEQPSVVTIGVFDGVHRGHQYLIRRLAEEARKTDRLAVVLTFFPHPDVVLRNLQGRYYLTSPEQRAEELLKLGVDVVITHPFNQTVADIRAVDFIDMLVNHLKVASLWVGKDFALGYKREGDIRFLRQQGWGKGYEVQIIEMVQAENADSIISSTMIRQALESGEVEQANQWLGRTYTVKGEVTHGEKRGRSIGFPTANIAVWEEQVIPANGVYAGWAQLGDERFMAVTNIGIRPTFDGKAVTVEAHLLDFDRDIYGKTLDLSFDFRLRGEKKFNGLQELIDQIQTDAVSGRELLMRM
jgi:riboflavin kinase / FMN adenylyltransferase